MLDESVKHQLGVLGKQLRRVWGDQLFVLFQPFFGFLHERGQLFVAEEKVGGRKNRGFL